MAGERRESGPKEPSAEKPVSQGEHDDQPQTETRHAEISPPEHHSEEPAISSTEPETEEPATSPAELEAISHVDRQHNKFVYSDEDSVSEHEDGVPRRGRTLTRSKEVTEWFIKQKAKKKRKMMMVERDLNEEVETLIDEVHRSHLSLAFSNRQLIDANNAAKHLMGKMDNLHYDMKQLNDETEAFIINIKSQFHLD